TGRRAADVITFCEVAKPRRVIAWASVEIRVRDPNSAELLSLMTKPAVAGSRLTALTTSAKLASGSRISLSMRRAACGKTGTRQESACPIGGGRVDCTRA